MWRKKKYELDFKKMRLWLLVLLLVAFQSTFSCIIIGCSSLQLIWIDGAGGKGTWGKLLDTDGCCSLWIWDV